jgi:hypothetical protein
MPQIAPWLVACGLLVLVFLWRALYFELRFRFLREAERRWLIYVKTIEEPDLSDPRVRWLEERMRKVIRLVEEAGTAPGRRTIGTDAGYGRIAPATFDLMENWLTRNEEVTPAVNSALIRAQGHYKDERNRSLNPLSWIESLVFLPRNVISAIDPRVPKWVKDLVQIVYWIITAVAALFQAGVLGGR